MHDLVGQALWSMLIEVLHPILDLFLAPDVVQADGQPLHITKREQDMMTL